MPRLRTPVAPVALVGWLALAACPQTTQPTPVPQAAPAPPPTDDKRVVADSSDYYPADKGTPTPQPVARAPGSGSSDDTNDKCRLYAPELPDPECCERDLGFAVDTVKRACGYKLYLGESFYATCGYYFLQDVSAQGQHAKWFRLSSVTGATAKESADTHDVYTRQMTKNPGFTSTPIPGIPGAFWSSHEELHWAFLPGWSVVRQLTWQDDSCSDEGVLQILQQLVNTPEVAAGTPRTAKIPGGPATPAPAPAQDPAAVAG